MDPKEKLVSHEALEEYNKQIRKKNNSGEKRSPPPDDDGINVISMDSNSYQLSTPQEKKKPKINRDLLLVNNSRSGNQGLVQHQASNGYNSSNVQQDVINISNQALSFTIENNFAPVKIECSPPFQHREEAKRFIVNFFKVINNEFRKEYPKNQ
jgi:hypothetical protein